MEQSLHRTVQGQGALALSPLFFIPPLAYPKQLCFGYVSCAVILWEEIRESKIVQNPSSAASSVNFRLDRISSYRKAAETIGSFFTLGFLIHSDCPRRGATDAVYACCLCRVGNNLRRRRSSLPRSIQLNDIPVQRHLADTESCTTPILSAPRRFARAAITVISSSFAMIPTPGMAGSARKAYK